MADYIPLAGNPTAIVNGETWEMGLWPEKLSIDGTTDYTFGIFIKDTGPWRIGLAGFNLNDTNPKNFQPPTGAPYMFTLHEAIVWAGSAAALVGMFIAPKLNPWLKTRYGAGGPGPNPTPADVQALLSAIQGYKVGADSMSIVPR